MSHNDELSLFRNEVADVRPIRNDHIRLQTASSPTDIRCLLILHGKGERSTPRALLKSYVSAWLPQLPAVMAMHSAERRHGGGGALYVLLRKSERKKAENRERHQKRLG
ncbi:Smr/MutS family protein [Aeromonas hydrophila]|uniref:Smr/MutS family protein n=1 Tax=Aeromonas hydrophila TaxID=644 RepID=UPI00235E6796|nr:Smr/MutS family protein [Aeromonas hydrophila]WDA23515.1 Smr/MutS family protein [Aeromonas hydrophila]WES93576.1 Smr/MutS family protein [Aeromonas hydrophila]